MVVDLYRLFLGIRVGSTVVRWRYATKGSAISLTHRSFPDPMKRSKSLSIEVSYAFVKCLASSNSLFWPWLISPFLEPLVSLVLTSGFVCPGFPSLARLQGIWTNHLSITNPVLFQLCDRVACWSTLLTFILIQNHRLSSWQRKRQNLEHETPRVHTRTVCITFQLNRVKNEDCGIGTHDLLCKRQEMIQLDDRGTGNRADPYTEPNSCFSDSSDSLNSLNSLNSMKVLLHLEKTILNLNFLDVRFLAVLRL